MQNAPQAAVEVVTLAFGPKSGPPIWEGDRMQVWLRVLFASLAGNRPLDIGRHTWYGASRLFGHKIRRRITFALLTFRGAYLIFRTIIVRGQIPFLSFCNNDLQDLNF